MPFTKEIIDFSELSHDAIKKKLVELNIPLTIDEALKIQNEMLGRAPSIAELVLFSIQGSEHCSYKSSRTHLKQFTTEGPDVVLGAKEDAGVVSITKDKLGNRWCVVMSHESHNHPSQIVPYEGAATGVGGNVRDVMCMGAEVIGCTDSFRFGDIKKQIPACTSCHAVYGQGNRLAGYPAIAGQQIGYLTSTLKAYRLKERNAGESSLVMQSIAQNLTDYDIEALANYMHGLYQ